MQNKNSLATPAGLKDYLPQEAALKRHLENKWAELFFAWGYQEVVTPSLEYYHTLTRGLGNDDLSLHKMIDRNGQILALRSDMTNPIARMVASTLQSEPWPLRFFYLANVFRYEAELQKGRQREFYQAGVELLGAQNSWADAEVIALAVEALESAGLTNFEIGLGHVEITRDLLAILCKDEERQQQLQDALTQKNYVAVDNLLTSTSSREARVKELITRQWRNNEIINNLHEVADKESTLKAIAHLENVLDVLHNFGFSDKVFVDLSILRDFNYYTGIVFEGYTTKLGYPLLGGGRYNKLLQKFGFDCPATGFALGIERVMAALPWSTKDITKKIDYLLLGKDYSLLHSKACELREKGYSVEIDLLGRSIAEAQKYAEKKGISEVIEVAGERK